MHHKFIIKQNIKYKWLNYPKLKKYKEVIVDLDNFTNQFHWMFDYYKNCFYYLTENTQLFPNRENVFVPGMGYKCLVDNVYPDDIEYMLEIQKNAFNYFLGLKTKERMNCLFAFKIRLLTKRGDYISYVFEIKVAALDNEGNLWMSLANAVPSHSDRLFHPLIISTINQKVLCFPDVKHSKMDYSYPGLSGKEIEVVRLMGRNKSTEEICNALQVSPSMCKKHRNSLFRKLNATNSVVALENARLLGILEE